MAKKQARVLTDHSVGGVAIKCNQVIEADAEVIASLEIGGVVDSGKEAVAYAKTLSGDVVDLAAAPTESEAAPAA